MKLCKALVVCIAFMFGASLFGCAVSNGISYDDNVCYDESSYVLSDEMGSVDIHLSSAYLGKTYTVKSNINTLIIDGDYSLTETILDGFSICVDSRSNDLNIYLTNVGFKSLKEQPAIYSKDYSTSSKYKINLICTDDVVIYGSNQTNSQATTSTIYSANVNITLDGDLKIYGGNGASSSNGLSAISTYDLTVSGNGTLTAVGGDGGIGTSGVNGSKGQTGANAVEGTIKSTSGTIGGSGGKGSNGGNGGYGISSQSITISDAVHVYAIGGNGGAGGNGGNGGNGGSGGQNQWFVVKTPICGNGGPGGNGGAGGNGGNGGNGLISGNYGTGGLGGTKGYGGNKGVVIADITHKQFQGKNGPNGLDGRKGNIGQNGDEATVPSISYVVSFNTNGGNNLKSQNVYKGNTAEIPQTPVREGTDEYYYSFEGWYLNSSLTQEYSFDMPITKNITLYAKWSKVDYPKYTIIFESNGGSSVSNQTVSEGKKALVPTEPVYSDGTYDYAFGGWYIDPSLSYEYNFATPVTQDMTLYAKWEKSEKSYLILFESNGGSNIESQTVVENGKVIKPADPTRKGGLTYEYTFGGWYSDSSLSYEYDFTDGVSQDMTLYAKWNRSNCISLVISIPLIFGGSMGTPLVYHLLRRS